MGNIYVNLLDKSKEVLKPVRCQGGGYLEGWEDAPKAAPIGNLQCGEASFRIERGEDPSTWVIRPSAPDSEAVTASIIPINTTKPNDQFILIEMNGPAMEGVKVFDKEDDMYTAIENFAEWKRLSNVKEGAVVEESTGMDVRAMGHITLGDYYQVKDAQHDLNGLPIEESHGGRLSSSTPVGFKLSITTNPLALVSDKWLGWFRVGLEGGGHFSTGILWEYCNGENKCFINSGHLATTIAAEFMLSKYVNKMPNWLDVGFFAGAALVGWQRINAFFAKEGAFLPTNWRADRLLHPGRLHEAGVIFTLNLIPKVPVSFKLFYRNDDMNVITR